MIVSKSYINLFSLSFHHPNHEYLNFFAVMLLTEYQQDNKKKSLVGTQYQICFEYDLMTQL